jgi:hypothetical protein
MPFISMNSVPMGIKYVADKKKPCFQVSQARETFTTERKIKKETEPKISPKIHG